MQTKSPWPRVWELADKEHGGLIRAIVSALIGVAGGILPYYAAAQIIIGLVGGNRSMQFYLLWCGVGLGGYLVRTLLYSLALAMARWSDLTVGARNTRPLASGSVRTTPEPRVFGTQAS